MGEKKRNPILFVLKEGLKWFCIFISFFLLMCFVMQNCIINAYIPSGSMIPTVNEGDIIVGNRMVKTYKHGDIAIFLSESGPLYIKRVIGVGGDHIEIKNHAVYRNGKKLKESYIKEEMYTKGTQKYDVPEGCYFLLGDNRNSSNDSRYWKNPYIRAKDMRAKAIFQYYPKIKKL